MEQTAPEQIKFFPELSFHYGLSLAELCTMPAVFLKLYITKLPVLLAHKQLAAFEASLVTSYSERDLEQRLEELHETINEGAEEKMELTPEMYEFKMASLGVGIKFVDQDGNDA